MRAATMANAKGAAKGEVTTALDHKAREDELGNSEAHARLAPKAHAPRARDERHRERRDRQRELGVADHSGDDVLIDKPARLRARECEDRLDVETRGRRVGAGASARRGREKIPRAGCSRQAWRACASDQGGAPGAWPLEPRQMCRQALALAFANNLLCPP